MDKSSIRHVLSVARGGRESRKTVTHDSRWLRKLAVVHRPNRARHLPVESGCP